MEEREKNGGEIQIRSLANSVAPREVLLDNYNMVIKDVNTGGGRLRDS